MSDPTLLRHFTPSIDLQTTGLTSQNSTLMMIKQARIINQCNQLLSTLLPLPFSEQLSLIRLDNKTALLSTTSSAIAFRAKQQSQLILTKLNTHPAFSNIQAIKIKIV